ncbi:MAG: 16S ribosomal RNA methyltransferase RsmE [Ignavibacteria bacterium]|nr:MAG: 16S ribosomal RNA methyltransferase RsmE [Ignavibacteria bacterium]KAF0160325.1 MAG: 16S ribosomal RNA methyltransferase RsmE [Ignavibacteria bacterium]
MQPVFLFNTELYYSEYAKGSSIEVAGEEFHHLKDVMRHKIGDEIFVTDGKGVIYKTEINLIEKKSLSANIVSSQIYSNPLSNITFCIPRLKSADRLEFALEKCVELGITNFIVFDSNRTVAKGEKLERWQKIITSAMKQSLRAWLPNVRYCKAINEIVVLEGKKYFFDQNAEKTLSSIPKSQFSINNCFLVFGPEGGFSENELKIVNGEFKIRLTENRLRSETAIVVAASILAANLVL